MSVQQKVLPDLFIVPDFDNAKVVVRFTPPQNFNTLKWEICDKGCTVNHGAVDIKSAEKVSFEAAIPDFIPWTTENPYLYVLKIALNPDSQNLSLSQHFGMRKIHATSEHIFVNNEQFYIRGYIRGREAHDHPNLCNLELEEFYAKNIRNAKKYGFNLIRFHSRVPEQECFDAADKLGMFIHIEVRNYFGPYQKERATMNDCGELITNKDWIDAIINNRNHPSLMVYCMGNEIRHPGANPRVAEIAEITKKYDQTRLFVDTCAHGEFDRDHVDIDVQHMSYFYPFGKDYDMFENTYNWYIYGSAKGAVMVKQVVESDSMALITRAIEPRRPVLAHEICHYVALHDLKTIEKKFDKYNAAKPWWLDELKKLVKLKNLEADYPQMLAASSHFQFVSWKLGIEAARRSPLLSGFHFLQLSDTDRYENSNGVLDSFDDCKGVDDVEFCRFNGDTVILAELPRRTYFEGERVKVPVFISHFSPKFKGMVDFVFVLRDKTDGTNLLKGSLEGINLDTFGRRELCQVELNLPHATKAMALQLQFKIIAVNKSYTIENSWDVWLYPDRPQGVVSSDCTIVVDDVQVAMRYPKLISGGSIDAPRKLLIVNRFSEQVLRHLERGGNVWCMYRVPETRDRLVRAPKEEYYLPATWDRLKGVIWDRGTNCGGFIRPNSVFDGFPNSGFMDLQFHGLIDDCDKIILDDFPCEIEPIMQGVDKAVRDRYDVKKYELPGFQPAWTMRKFAYAFELQVGKGKLFITGFNFTGINRNKPETCTMFESIFRYLGSDAFQPAASMPVEKLKSYLLRKAKSPRIKERKMTQFWQLDTEPLESAQYWQDSENYIAE